MCTLRVTDEDDDWEKADLCLPGEGAAVQNNEDPAEVWSDEEGHDAHKDGPEEGTLQTLLTRL